MNDGKSDQTMASHCPQCGAPLSAEALGGLCPACLLRQGATAETATQGESTPFQPPGVEEVARLFPQLEILSFIGKGGMGAVYKARQPALDRLVALKLLPPQVAGGPGFAERFAREARALAKLSHPNIVAVYEFGQVNGLPFFLMEFVDGLNLRELERAGRLSPREALEIVPQICEALQFAHDEGVVHRDIKPENILLDKKGRVKIADFGIAKIMGADAGNPAPAGSSQMETGAPGAPHSAGALTEEGKIIGTPNYMAPEQSATPQAVDHRADIFSLGVVFYEMLTGELPLGKFAPPSSRIRGVTVDVRLDEVVLRALEKEPERRYQQASQVKTAVETIVMTQNAASPQAGADAPSTGAATEQTWKSPTTGWGWLVGQLFGVTFTSPMAYKLANLSAIGFLGSFAFLGFVPLPGMKICFGFSGFAGFFGLVGFAVIIELSERARAKALKTAQSNPLPVMDFWQALELGEYARAWGMTAPYFQRSNQKEEWMARMEKVRRPLGRALSRKIVSMHFINPGTRFEEHIGSAFDSQQSAIETVVCALQPDGEWKVEKYDLHPVSSIAGAPGAWSRGFEYRSRATLFGLPLLHVATGCDPVTGRVITARGIIAIGGMAQGVVAIGGVAMGGLAFGGLSIGAFAFGGCALGLVGFGGLAIALVAALGGLAIALIALGGGAIGYLAYGGAAYGIHALGSNASDEIARHFFLPWAKNAMASFMVINNVLVVLVVAVGIGVPLWLRHRMLKGSSIPGNPAFPGDARAANRSGSRSSLLWRSFLMVALVFLIDVMLWWSKHEPEGVWLPTRMSSAIGEPYGEAQIRVTDVSQIGQVLLVKFVCDTGFGLTNHELFVQYSGPMFDYPAGIASSVTNVDCLVAPSFMNGDIRNVVAGSWELQGKPSREVGFIMPDEKTATEALEQVRQVNLGKPHGLTAQGSALMLFSLYRHVGNNASGDRITENLNAMLAWPPTGETLDERKSAFAFGPETEWLVTAAIDFDSNKMADIPDSLTQKSSIAENVSDGVAWMEREGMDAILATSGSFLGVDLKVEPLNNDTWENMTATQLLPTLESTSRKAIQSLNPGTNVPATYAFQTREGGSGILQVLAFTDDGVKVRYKLLQNAGAPAVVVGPADLTLAEQPPVVVETQPVSGARDVAPGETEIRVRYSKQMSDGAWSWSAAWNNSTPEIIGQPHFESDGRTCVLKARLEPGRTYAWWLNSEKFHNFADQYGRPAVPYLLIFQTKTK